jgi:hypothetical protein
MPQLLVDLLLGRHRIDHVDMVAFLDLYQVQCHWVSRCPGGR